MFKNIEQGGLMNKTENVINCCERWYDVPPGSILQHGRRRSVVKARALSQYIIKKYTSLTYFEMEEVYKHSTKAIANNVRKVTELLQIGDKYTSLALSVNIVECDLWEVKNGYRN